VTEENVHTALVYGIVHDEDEDIELVIGSMRTSKITLDPDEFLKEAFGQDNQGPFLVVVVIWPEVLKFLSVFSVVLIIMPNMRNQVGTV